ncbi:MAG: FAD-dependent monooxygenase [Deltaproteobacteria bacterium]|nr:FAD-dependent monooxygenase [Deltaproteobacteria bacterium]MBW2390135.1 FAD-dependent monooxygenase [Deltaproteobacteria bacterium]MBW2726600.1 FAD-dependent monooxygenase [Deltaproteobacteria bacterium]
MSSSLSRHAVVVGAGPAGAVLSNLLATRGVRVTLQV